MSKANSTDRIVEGMVIKEIIEEIRNGDHSESLWQDIEKILVHCLTAGRDAYEDMTLEAIVYAHAKKLLKLQCYQDRIAELHKAPFSSLAD